jgi:molecular chaperone HscC
MIVGIDLGTTHSLIGAWIDGSAKLFANALGEVLTPSVVSVDAHEQILVGAAAQERLHTHPERSIAAFKRGMGSERKVRLGKQEFRPEELSALVLKSLIADAEAALGTPVREAVISVPAYFSDAQRRATRHAGELAGIKVERLINEPTAAALAYGLEQRNAESKFLIFDLGGGTFDVSILELFEGVMEVHASAGDNFLGGEDFVTLLESLVLSDLKLDAKQLNALDGARLRKEMERAKRQLSQHQQLELNLELAGGTHSVSLSQARFEQAAEPLLARMRAPIERALRDAKLRSSDLNEIVLVGGAVRMPMVARLITRLFARLPLRHLSPDEVIALGAAVFAGMISRDQAFKEVVMTDVCPYTLGVETASVNADQRIVDGQFSPIIERNTVVPTSRVETYWPLHENQTQVVLNVYQGESPRVVNNVKLGTLNIPLKGIPKHEAGFDVRFSYDVSGILEVDVTVHKTGATHNLVLVQNPSVMTPEQLEKSRRTLASLKIHPRDDQANIAVLARAERLYEERLGETRMHIMQMINAFRSELEGQDARGIEQARSKFVEALNHIESEQVL